MLFCDCRIDVENSGSNAAAVSGDDDDDGGSIFQGIGQSQRSNQDSNIASEGDTTNSGNNFSVQEQTNSGSNAAAYSGGEGFFVSQGIGQSQVSNQASNIVSGGDTTDSGNSYSRQSQSNSGSNAFLGQ